MPTDERSVALVIRMYGHRGITQHGLGTSGCNDKVLTRVIGQRVTEMPQVTLLLLRDDLQVRNRGLQDWIPVNQTFAPVDEAFIE